MRNSKSWYYCIFGLTGEAKVDFTWAKSDIYDHTLYLAIDGLSHETSFRLLHCTPSTTISKSCVGNDGFNLVRVWLLVLQLHTLFLSRSRPSTFTAESIRYGKQTVLLFRIPSPMRSSRPYWNLKQLDHDSVSITFMLRIALLRFMRKYSLCDNLLQRYTGDLQIKHTQRLQIANTSTPSQTDVWRPSPNTACPSSHSLSRRCSETSAKVAGPSLMRLEARNCSSRPVYSVHQDLHTSTTIVTFSAFSNLAIAICYMKLYLGLRYYAVSWMATLGSTTRRSAHLRQYYCSELLGMIPLITLL